MLETDGQSSARFRRFIVNPRLVGDPVHLPGFAAIVGEGLFRVSGVGSDVRPVLANEDDAAVVGVLAEELAASVFEFAHIGWTTERAVLAVGPVKTPLMSFRIVKAQRETFDAAGWTGDVELLEPGAAVPHFARYGRAVKLDPGVGSGHGMQETLEVNLPGAAFKIEVVLAVAFVGAGLRCGFGSVRVG